MTTTGLDGDGDVTETGSATSTESGGNSFSYDGGYDYSQSGNGGTQWSFNGHVDESGGAGNSYQYTTHSALDSDGTWQVTDGSGSTSGTGNTHWGFSGSGSYSYNVNQGSDSVSGTFNRTGSDDTSYGFATTSTLGSDGNWTTTGICQRHRQRLDRLELLRQRRLFAVGLRRDDFPRQRHNSGKRRRALFRRLHNQLRPRFRRRLA